MPGTEFDVFLGKNGEIGLKGYGKLTSCEALEEFLANVRLPCSWDRLQHMPVMVQQVRCSLT